MRLALLTLTLSALPALAQAPAAGPAGPEQGGWLVQAGWGGPGGNFDWCIPAGQVVVLDTTSAVIVGGPHCTPTTTQQVLGGVVEVRNLWIAAGAVLKVQGPNPLVVMASGTVRIDGTLDLSGTSSPGVVTLNTTSIPEPGAPGQAGGGRGGIGSPSTTASSPEGGDGFGAFGTPGRGGRGGETGWNNVSNAQVDGRRGAGGGGGAFGHDQAQQLGPVSTFGLWDQAFLGLDAEPGFGNLHPSANGALSGAAGPFGGRPGPRPFVDGDPTNDFYGFGRDLQTGAIVAGELSAPWAGAGGGAGGDASFVGAGGTFPATPFNPAGDEKGAGGAGGGGSLEVLALGDIVFGPTGLILCRGGSGGGGENTLFLNRVGGGSGGGSGGHVILQTPGKIDLSRSLGPAGTPGQLAGGILATGGQGGGGKDNVGGAGIGSQGKLETVPHLDACPNGYPTSGSNACLGHVDGAGGDGGPGLVQLHTRTGFDPANPSILLPPGLTLSDVCKPLPVGADGSILLLPRFPSRSPGDGKQSDGEKSAAERVERLRLRPGEGLLGPGRR